MFSAPGTKKVLLKIQRAGDDKERVEEILSEYNASVAKVYHITEKLPTLLLEVSIESFSFFTIDVKPIDHVTSFQFTSFPRLLSLKEVQSHRQRKVLLMHYHPLNAQLCLVSK